MNYPNEIERLRQKAYPPKKFWRLVYTVNGIASNGLHIEKRLSELWKMNRQPLFEEVAKHWENLADVTTRVANLKIIECDPMLDKATPVAVEL